MNINYQYMFLVEMRPAKTEGSDTRTAPVSEKIIRFVNGAGGNGKYSW